MKHARLLISCEHASNRVPAGLRSLFDHDPGVLATHRAFDIGADGLARAFALATGAPLHAGEVTRLLVDLNRSEHHRRLFSDFTCGLELRRKEQLLKKYYRPFRDAVIRQLHQWRDTGDSVLHLSVHSFTPEACGMRRHCDLGLLYDPRRRRERELAVRWRERLMTESGLRVRRNYPYRGTADGHVTALRRRLGEGFYAGFELEVNQALTVDGCFPRELERLLAGTLMTSLATPTRPDRPVDPRRW